MSTRSKLLFQAHGKISNPFMLCTLVSKRTRQIMMSPNGTRCTADSVDYALSELLAGALEFEMPAGKERKIEPPVKVQPKVTSREALEVGTT